ncbi:S8 family serine peptidase [Flavobacterium sp. 3-218]
MITVNNKFFNQQWGLKLINVEKAWDLLNNSQSINGSSNEKSFGSPTINVAIVDQGVETKNNLSVHKSFSGQTTVGNPKFLKNIAFEYPQQPFFDIKDFLGGSHGMEVSGIAMAKAQINNLSAYNGEGIIGVAPNCSFYSISTNNIPRIRLFSMFALAGLEYTSPKLNVLNDAYNITTDKITVYNLFKDRGTTNAGSNLNFFLNDSYADIFSLSIQALNAPGLINENYSKIIFNEISFFGRKGRGALSVIGSGNNGLDIEPRPNEFLNEFAYSNKPIIVGAVSVDNGYNWLTNSPPANSKKSNYSNFGARVDICAPGGGEGDDPAFTPPLGLQNKNKIFSTTVKGAGNICSNSPLKLSLKTKVSTTEFSPPNADYFASVELEFNNTNGVYAGQAIIIGEFSSLNNYEIYYVDAVIPGNKISIKEMKKTAYTNLIDSSGTVNRSILEFSPMFTKIVSISTNRTFKVEYSKGAFASTTDKIYIGTLGDSSIGISGNISRVDSINDEITLVSGTTVNVGDYVVFPRKSSVIISGNRNNSDKIMVQNIEGFFPGGFIDIDESDAYSNILTIDIPNKIITLKEPLSFTRQTPGTKYVKNMATGDITDQFIGTSAATPFVSGVAALVLSANPDLSAAEVKHILKETASSTLTISNLSTPHSIPAYSLNSDGYMHNTHYGTGLVDAGAAVDLALKWHTSATLQKPKMEIADKLNANVIEQVTPNNPVISPDIWVKSISDPNLMLPPSGTQLFNTITTTDNQVICVRVRNTGNRKSFKECDLRVLVAFTDEDNPAFPFPEQWYDYNPNQDATPPNSKPCVKLLAVKEIPIIAPNSEIIIQIPWNDIAAFWEDNNPLPTAGGVLVPSGKRKRAYILAHIAPFDGIFDMDNSDPTNPINLSLANIRHNKQLSCKEIIVTHNGVNNRTAYIPGNKLNITVGTNDIEKTFDLNLENVLASEFDVLKIKASKKNRGNQKIEEVIYQKTGTSWALESGNSDWIAFEAPKESISVHNGYKNVIFSHKLTINEEEEEIKLEIINS